MFDDVATRTPRSGSSIEAGLLRLLSPGSVLVDYVIPGAGYEVAAEAAGHPARTNAGAGAGFLPGALTWDAQFAAGAAALDQVRDAHVVIGRAEARRARGLAAFARSRPVSGDRPDAEVGAAAAASRAARPVALAGVSEWAVDEVAVALGVTGSSAAVLLADSLRLVSALPATLAALEEGRIGWGHVRVMTDLVAPLADEGVRAEAERRLLSRVASKTPPQLREAARRVVARLDAEAITERVEDAARTRGVSLYPGEDAMGTLAAVLPLPIARAVHDALAQYADAATTTGDQRTKAQRMADCLVDLVLRPGEHGMSPVQARVTIVAAVQTLLGGDEPGEVDGDLIPAAMVRELATALGLLSPDDQSVTATGEEPVEGASADRTFSGSAHDDSAAARLAALAGLLGTRTIAGTTLAHRPDLALVNQDTGALACLTDAAGLCRAATSGRGLGPPPPSPGYRPGSTLEAFVRHRDRRCRFPGCRARASRCDLDHTTPWPHGWTSADNLCCLCRHHHRLSHQAPGWRLRGLPDGGLRWTTPTGQTLTTHPPGYGTEDDQPPATTAATTAEADPAPPPF